MKYTRHSSLPPGADIKEFAEVYHLFDELGRCGVFKFAGSLFGNGIVNGKDFCEEFIKGIVATSFSEIMW